MALSGSFYHYVYQQFGLYCEWSGTQSATGNYTDVLLKVYVSYYTLNIGTREGTISINGSSSSFTSPEIRDMSGGSHKKVLVATKTVRVNHNTNGTKTDVPISVTWNCTLTYHGTYYSSISTSTTIDLDAIDRTAPTVAHSTSNITANGFKISATSSVTADIWEYSIDGGSNYTQFSTTAGTTASVTLTNLSPNTTYSVRVRARKKSNHVYGYSTAANVKTLGGSIITGASTTYIDASLPTLAFTVTVYESSYYHRLTVKNGSTTVFSTDLGRYSAGAGQSKTYTLTTAQRTAMLNQIPNAKYFYATLELSSYSDSGYTTQVGNASTVSALMSTQASLSSPTFTAFTYRDSRTVTAAATENDQVLIAGYSTLLITATAGTAKNGASIASYSVEIGDVSKSFTTTSMSVGVVNTSGTLTLRVTCIDSRGYSKSVTQTVKVLEYSKPKLSSCTVRRKDEIEDVIQLSFTGSFSAIKADGTNDTNSLKYAGYYYKRTDQTTWSSYVSIKNDVTVSGNFISFSTNQLLVNTTTALSLDTDRSWDFHLLIRDELDNLASCDLYVTIPQGMPLVSLRKSDGTYNFPRVGINEPEPKATLDVNGSIYMNGQQIMGFVALLDDSTDLNDITTNGIYTQSTNADATTALHYPAEKAGWLEVIAKPSGAVLQRYTVNDCSAVYLRSKISGTWGNWKSLATA